VTTAPIILVPGFWLGAWAWDDLASALRADGLDVTPLTLPGLESADVDRSTIRLSDHVDAICEAVQAAGTPVVLAVHSAAGVSGYAASDRVPEQIAAMVYVDSGPATGALDPGFHGVEMPLPSWEELQEDGSSIEGLSDAQLDAFRKRAVPEPGGAIREGHDFANDSRLDVPSTVICTSMTSEEIRAAAEAGYPWIAGLAELRNVRYVDMPTGHWPMWSRPLDVAAAIADVARSAAAG
jgi:pimeloyl-ACP methyl ester carboxylesterase